MIEMAARTLSEMAAKGARKLSAKASIMTSNYSASKGRMKAGYAALPFGPNTKAAYAAGVDAGRYRAPDPAKWSKNWVAKVSL